MIWDFRLMTLRRLLLWSSLSVLAGLFLIPAPDPAWMGYGWLSLAAGLVSGLAAFPGTRSASRCRHLPASPERQARAASALRQRLLKNAFWSLMAAATGLFLLLLGQGNSMVTGICLGLLMQGAFLGSFHLLHYHRLPPPCNIPPFPIYEGAEFQPFDFPGGPAAAILVHGFPGTPQEMRALGLSLNKLGLRTRGLLLPGFGAGLPTLFDRRADEWVVAVQEEIQALRKAGCQPIFLVGFSMGGAISLAAASKNPPDALILLAPFSWPEPAWFTAIIESARLFIPVCVPPFRYLNLHDPQTQAALRLLLPRFDANDTKMVATLRQFQMPLITLEQLRRIGKAARLSAGRLNLPTLVVQGTKDEVVRPVWTRSLVRKFPSPPLFVEIPAVHHFTQPANPAYPKVEAIVLDYIQHFLFEQPPAHK